MKSHRKCQVTADQVLCLSEADLLKTPKPALQRMLRVVCDRLKQERQSHQEEVAQLRDTIAHEVRERQKATQREINQTANQPSSKKAEWDKANPTPQRRRKRRGRPGAGNRPKPQPDVTHENPLLQCPLCSTDLSERPILETPTRPVHEEILLDLKAGVMIFADETGWRIRGALWWLWIFANTRSAYYWPDRQRGSLVVQRILGTVFSGVLITDAWCAYHRIVCTKQTCMAHIFRKIRKFRDAYPQYWSLVCFYRRLRRIVEDGERLKKRRSELGEEAFERRVGLLEHRLDELLAWKNPNAVLKTVIDKVSRQKDYILTFVRHPGVPKHNNFGEYIIKRGILKRKVSGGSTSAEGAMAYARIQSVAMTCQLRGLPFRDYLLQCLRHYLNSGTPLLLADYERQWIITEKKQHDCKQTKEPSVSAVPRHNVQDKDHHVSHANI